MRLDVLLFCLLIGVMRCMSIEHGSDECPSYKIHENRSDVHTMDELKRKSVKEVWSSEPFQSLSPLMNQLNDAIFEIVDSESHYLIQLAFQYTGWAISFLGNAQHLYQNYCPFAKAINESVEWKSCDKADKYIQSLDTIVNTIDYILSGFKYASLKELDCKNVSDPLKETKACWQNGFELDGKGVWENFGTLIPWPLRFTICQLESSKIFTERAAAVLFYFSLIPQASYIWNAVDECIFLEMFKLYSQPRSSSVSKCCCDEWEQRLYDLSINVKDYAVEAEDEKIKELDNECDGLIVPASSSEPTTETTETTETLEQQTE